MGMETFLKVREMGKKGNRFVPHVTSRISGDHPLFHRSVIYSNFLS